MSVQNNYLLEKFTSDDMYIAIFEVYTTRTRLSKVMKLFAQLQISIIGSSKNRIKVYAPYSKIQNLLTYSSEDHEFILKCIRRKHWFDGID